jgi:hypothetical protein
MTPAEKEQIKNELINDLRAANEDLKVSVESLKTEIRDEINRSAIKKEIVDQVLTKRSRSSGFWQHPVTLLVLGFVFTTLCGAALTSCWKTREWQNEQYYLAAQTRCERERSTRTEEIKQKYEVKDEIIRRVAETNTAAEEILIYFQMDPARRSKEGKDRIAYWKEASRSWRTNEKILKQRLLLRFTDPNISNLFEEIVKYRNFVGVNINNQQEELSDGRQICREIVNQANLCMGHITGNLMPQVIKGMNEEILSDEKALRAAQCALDPSNTTNNPSPSPQATAPGPQNNAELDACEVLLEKKDICDSKKKH